LIPNWPIPDCPARVRQQQSPICHRSYRIGSPTKCLHLAGLLPRQRKLSVSLNRLALRALGTLSRRMESEASSRGKAWSSHVGWLAGHRIMGPGAPMSAGRPARAGGAGRFTQPAQLGLSSRRRPCASCCLHCATALPTPFARCHAFPTCKDWSLLTWPPPYESRSQLVACRRVGL
jgi:hypothetical protein